MCAAVTSLTPIGLRLPFPPAPFQTGAGRHGIRDEARNEGAPCDARRTRAERTPVPPDRFPSIGAAINTELRKRQSRNEGHLGRGSKFRCRSRPMHSMDVRACSGARNLVQA
jgi:hypothetical protein